jgi:hypothetical protein
MKKWLLILVVILIISSIASYVLIPSVIKLSKIEKVAASSEEVFRYFTTPQLRDKWMPASTITDNLKSKSITDSSFSFENENFRVASVQSTSATIIIGNENEKINSQVLMVSQGVDSTVIIWEAEINAGSNPISRINGYLTAQRIQNYFTGILDVHKKFITVPENVYTFPIVTEQVKDTILIASRKVFATNPGTTEIYAMVTKLEAYAIANDAKLTNAPMLNITVLDSSHYQCTVAIPVNKEIKNGGDMYLSKMVPGKILVETVKGGPATIKYAFIRLQDYFRQHKHVSPAIPFESLITNRNTETDTSKWVTKIYYPIF